MFIPVNYILMVKQLGFRSGGSVILCNLVINNNVYYSFQCRSQVDVVYIDFQKAFGSVNYAS